MKGGKQNRGFSLIELVIVVVIIGIIGAIAIPRMSRGAAGAADSSLKANLSVLRNAIDLYAAEHGGKYPRLADMQAASLIGGAPTGGNALLDYSDGNHPPSFSKTSSPTHIYGPYLRAIPKAPVGVDPSVQLLFVGAPGADSHWIYEDDSGRVFVNSEVNDASGKPYSEY